MLPNEIMAALVDFEFPMMTEEENGQVVRIIGEIVVDDDLQREFVQYRLKIFAKFNLDVFKNIENRKFKSYEEASTELACEIWFTHHEDSYAPTEVAIENGLLSVVFSDTIFNLLSNSLNEHSVQDLFDYILGSPCIFMNLDGEEFEPLEDVEVGLTED